MASTLNQKLEAKEQELKILHEVAKDISDNLDLSELLHRIVDTVTAFVKADSCLVYLYDEDHDELVLSASSDPKTESVGSISLKLGEGVTGWAAKEKQPVYLAKEAYRDKRFKAFTSLKEDRYEALLSIPILAKNRIVGVMNLQNKKEHAYPEAQIKLLFTIGRYLGSAIQNAITYDEVMKKARQLDLLSEVSRTIVSDHYIKEILHLIVTMTAKVMDSKICSVMLLDEKKEELVIAATQSLSNEYVNKPNLKVGQSISGRVVLEKRPLKVLDVTKEPGYMFPDVARKEGFVSLLSVPMMIKDQVVGVINSYTTREHVFTKEEIDILQAVANQAAVAIENTNLSHEILAAKEALESRKLVERAKGILMRELGLNEDEAYRKIHKKSMDTRKTMKEVAEAIILAFDIQKRT
ncbi:MAG: putative transcriptional regulatory protein pdtaR [Syntrophorhabdus sp. PtaB.Bin047]|jgi:signal transduction protein with GAF and PtsI domain|nr:MAG: putative transcriptional regulatory protein pdtaR [Syntrophorhabdus sp. PtaB.Bin047]